MPTAFTNDCTMQLCCFFFSGSPIPVSNIRHSIQYRVNYTATVTVQWSPVEADNYTVTISPQTQPPTTVTDTSIVLSVVSETNYTVSIIATNCVGSSLVTSHDLRFGTSNLVFI